MTQQPEALRLADFLLEWLGNNVEPAWLSGACVSAAVELRKQHEVIENLWQVAHHRNDRITELEAVLRQAVKDMVCLDNCLDGMPMSECIARLRKAITTAKQALGEKT